MTGRGADAVDRALPEQADRALAAEAAMSRQCLSKWKARFDTLGEVGLLDRSSAPAHSPTQLAEPVVARIEQLRQDKKWSARLIADELASDGVEVSVDLGHFSRLRKVNAQAAMG